MQKDLALPVGAPPKKNGIGLGFRHFLHGVTVGEGPKPPLTAPCRIPATWKAGVLS